MELFVFLILGIVSYLSGSLVWAKIITKFYKKDITEFGTGNPGVANFSREFGTKGAIAVFAGDLFTSFSVFTICLITIHEYSSYGIIHQILFACFILSGTFFPIFFKFKGGTGLAKFLGICCAINPLSFIFIFPFILIVFFKTRNFAILGTFLVILVTLSSVIVTYEYSLFLLEYSYPDMYGLYTLIACGLLVFAKGMHQYNGHLFYD